MMENVKVTLASPLPEELQLFMRYLESDLPAVYYHCLTTAAYCAALGNMLKLHGPDLTTFTLSGLFHDIGKCTLPPALLGKPAKLTSVERLLMQRHPTMSATLLDGHVSLVRVKKVVHQHHERFDGEGYPFGLPGSRIDHLALGLSVVDAYCALTEDRPYHAAESIRDALTELNRYSGTQFDPFFVDMFSQLKHEAMTTSDLGLIEQQLLGKRDHPLAAA